MVALMEWRSAPLPMGPLKGQRRFKKKFAWFPTLMTWESTWVWLESYVVKQEWIPSGVFSDPHWNNLSRMTMDQFAERAEEEVRSRRMRKATQIHLFPRTEPDLLDAFSSSWTSPDLLNEAFHRVHEEEA